MKSVLNPATNEVLGFDDNMSDDAIASAIQSDKDGRPLADVNPTPYDVMVRPALEQAKITGNPEILYDARRRANDADPFNRALLHGITFGLTPDLDPEEKKAYGVADTLGNLAGQTASILATAGVGEILGVGKLAATVGEAAKGALPAAAAAAEVGSGAILPVTAGEVAANTAAGVTSSAALGALYNGITESVNQGKIFASDHQAPDVAKIGESILKGAYTWAPYGVGASFIPKTAPGLATGVAATAGTAYLVSKNEGQSEPDARLNAVLMGMFHFVSHVGMVGTADVEPTKDNIARDNKGNPIEIGITPEMRKGLVEDLQNTMADYTKAKNGLTEVGNLHQMVGDEFVNQEAKNLVQETNNELASRPPISKIPDEPPQLGPAAIIYKSLARVEQAEKTAEKRANEPQINQQFNDPYEPQMLDYLASYIPPKEVARMSPDDRLALANAPWQELRDVAAKYESGELPNKTIVPDEVGRFENEGGALQQVIKSTTLTKNLIGNVTKKVIAAQDTRPQKIQSDNAGGKTAKEDLASLKVDEPQSVPVTDKGLGKEPQKETNIQSSTKESKPVSGSQSSGKSPESSISENPKGIENVEGKSTVSSLKDSIAPEGKKAKLEESGLAKSVAEQAIHKGLIDDFSGLPSSESRDMKDVAKRANDFIDSNPDLAKKIAFGEAPEQDNIRAQEMFTALRAKAIADKDIPLINELIHNEKAAAMAKELGQRVKALDSNDPTDPVRIGREIKQAWDEKNAKESKSIKRDQEQAVKKFKDEVKKSSPKFKDWNDFIDSIKC